MSHWKAKLPRVNPPVCWECDKKLYAGGRAYVLRKDPLTGIERPYHATCWTESPE